MTATGQSAPTRSRTCFPTIQALIRFGTMEIVQPALPARTALSSPNPAPISTAMLSGGAAKKYFWSGLYGERIRS